MTGSVPANVTTGDRHESDAAGIRAGRWVAALLVPLAALPAAAHGTKKQGDLVMTVGFGTEPAFAGEVNSVQLLLVHDGSQ
jgi:hypothetical protein